MSVLLGRLGAEALAHKVSWHLASLGLRVVPLKGFFFRVLKIFLRVVPGF